MGEIEEPFDDHMLDLSVLLGFPASATRVHRGLNEFTIDFLRRVPEFPKPFLVARAIVSPAVGVELRDQLDGAWRGYYASSMPEDRDG